MSFISPDYLIFFKKNRKKNLTIFKKVKICAKLCFLTKCYKKWKKLQKMSIFVNFWQKCAKFCKICAKFVKNCAKLCKILHIFLFFSGFFPPVRTALLEAEKNLAVHNFSQKLQKNAFFFANFGTTSRTHFSREK